MPDPHPADDPPPVEPPAPDPDACCGQGCDPCVLDLYAAERRRYEEQLRAWRERQAARAGGKVRPARTPARKR